MRVEDTIRFKADDSDRIPDFVPPGTTRIGRRRAGIIELSDLPLLDRTTLSLFQAALRSPPP